MLNAIINCSTDVTKMIMRLPKKYIEPPKTPTVRIENFLNNVFVKRPAKLSAQKKQLVIIVTALVSSPKLVRKSLNINPNDGILLKAQICNFFFFFHLQTKISSDLISKIFVNIYKRHRHSNSNTKTPSSFWRLFNRTKFTFHCYSIIAHIEWLYDV